MDACPMIVFNCVQLCVQLCKTLCIIVSTIVFATVDASPVIANLFSVRRLELAGLWSVDNVATEVWSSV